LIHDELEELEGIEEVVLAHPYKTRLIADAQIKTDRLDAYALSTLLRGTWWRAPMCRGARRECAKIFCGKDSIGHGCAPCCVTVSMRCWIDSAAWSCRNARTSLACAG